MQEQQHRLRLLVVAAVLVLVGSACASRDGTGAGAPEAGDVDTAGMADLSATLNGRGSSFQDTFEQAVAANFSEVVRGAGGTVSVTYTKSGSSDGKRSLGDETVEFAGSDSPIKDEERASFGGRDVLYFPIIGGPIVVAFHLDGIDRLNLSAENVAKIFQAGITSWNDPAIASDNPGVDLPAEPITVVHRSDGAGTTKNFTGFLAAAAPDTWKLGSGEEVDWDPRTQGAEGSTGVTSVVASTAGAIGYSDLSDAAKESLSVAAIGNAGGEFVAPTPDAASAALGAAEIDDDLTYDPLNVDAPGAYPITSPTWILVDAEPSDAATADALKAYLRYVLTAGQAQAKALLYAPLPDDLAARAIAQIDEIDARR